MWRKKAVCGVVVIGLVWCVGMPASTAYGWGRFYGGVIIQPGVHFVVPPPVVFAPPVVVRPVPGVVVVGPPPVAYDPAPAYPPPPPAQAGHLEVTVSPLQAAVYLDGRYIGRAEDFRDGRVTLPVSPGTHTVELQYGVSSHTHTVQVHAGATVAVDDRL